MLVPKWADWDTFRELEHAGLTMYGQMTAGSWIYIGTQGILQGTYETLAECAAQRFGGSLAGTVTLTGGLGGMGGAQPLAVTMNGGVALCVEVDPARIERRIKTRYLDRETDDLDRRCAWVDEARPAREAVSIGLVGNCAEVLPDLVARGCAPDVVTDQTSAHDPLGGYVPAGLSLEEAAALRERRSRGVRAPGVRRRWRGTSTRWSASSERGAVVFDYGNNLRAGAELGGLAHDRAYAYPGFVPAFVRPMFCEGKGPFRWVALSGDPEDIAQHRPRRRRAVPRRRAAACAGSRWPTSGSRSRACPRGSAGSVTANARRAGLRFNEMVATRRAVGADRDRPRSPRQRERREPVPRDRGDERRLGRDRRLADPQRAREHRGRRALGERAPRRRRRDRLLDPRRDGRRGRRERRTRARGSSAC